MALRQLPPQERWEVARWLLEDLSKGAPGQVDATISPQSDAVPSFPNYSERRRRIFGEKVLPNMVLASRAEDRW